MKRIKIVIILFSVALIGLGLVQYSSIKTNVENNQDIENLNARTKKISQAYVVLKDMLDIETGSRGFILTGIPSFLEPYQRAMLSLGADLREFYLSLSAGEVIQISALIQKRLDRAILFVEKKQRGGVVSAEDQELGKKEMDAIRVAIREIVEHEEKYIDAKSIEVKGSSRKLLVELISASVFSFVFVFACVLYVLFELKKRIDAETKLGISLATSEANSREIDLEKKAAEKASLAKSDFLAKMSHEIRTPLNAILGVGDILSMTKLDQEQEHALGIFRRSAHTLNNLVNEILDLSKIEAGKAEILKAPFSLKELIESCATLVDLRADQKGLLFEKEKTFEHDHYLGDERRIRQILLNLLGNAVKFTEQGKVQLTITNTIYEQDYHEIRFSIKNSGHGFDADKFKNIFQNYQQDKILDDYDSTGLGLSLSKELALLMGGDILVSSELGKGSEFTFYVRLAALEGSHSGEKFDSNIKLKKLKILLVDDNVENRYIVKKYLAKYDFEIREAVDGIHAIECFKKEKFDITFMDINMPKMDGLTATREIRAWEKQNGLNNALIIALSANAFTKEFSKAKDAGCDDYLTKPISRSKLITMIKKWTGEEKENLSEARTDEIDEEIRALIPGYLEKRVQDLIILKEALDKKEIQVIARIAHNMKGTALSYGQEELDYAARELNSVSSEADWVKIEKAILKVELALAKK